jgi:hypothetical protein
MHIRRAGSPSEQWALLFRDYLRAHPGRFAAKERSIGQGVPWRRPAGRTSAPDSGSTSEASAYRPDELGSRSWATV